MGIRVVRASDFRPRTSNFQLGKCATGEVSLGDRISELPSEIIIHILSFLTVKEAVRTSVLSKSWVHLWMFVVRLDFDSSEVLDKLAATDIRSERHSFWVRESYKYVTWVNKALQACKALDLDEFRICFELDKSSQNEIDKWLHYAFARRVQRLELNLLEDGDVLCCKLEPYAFPRELLGLSCGKSLEEFPFSHFDNGIRRHPLMDFKSLRSICLAGVNVAWEVLKIFLHECRSLERLLVHNSLALESVEVCGPSLSLQHLEICYCFPVTSIIVCDTNLVSLKVTGGHDLILKNVPMLVDVYVAGQLVGDHISSLSCCLSNLEVLTLRVSSFDARQEELKVLELPQLPRLKQLTLVANAFEDDSLISLTSLIRAAPNLEKFSLKLIWEDNMVRVQRDLEEAPSLPLQRLKLVEFLGYYGRTVDVELVNYFLENATALERIVVDPRDQLMFGPYRYEDLEKEELARSYAKQQLRGLIPASAELVLL